MNKLQVSDFLVNEIPIVYHATLKYNAQKILEFGFDVDLSGQNCRRRFHNDHSIILTDSLAIKTESRLENNVINTMTDYERCRGCGDCLLQITLKHDIKLLDIQEIDPIPRLRRKWFAYARKNGFDGIKNKELVLLFGNKKIEKIEIVQRNDREFDFEILPNDCKNRFYSNSD